MEAIASQLIQVHANGQVFLVQLIREMVTICKYVQ